MNRSIASSTGFLILAAFLSCTRVYLGGNVSKLTGVRHEFRPGVQLGIGGEIAGSRALCGESMFAVQAKWIDIPSARLVKYPYHYEDPVQVRDYDLHAAPLYFEYALFLKRQFIRNESVKLGIMAGPGIYLGMSGFSKAVPTSDIRYLPPGTRVESADFSLPDETGFLTPPDAGLSFNAGLDYNRGNHGIQFLCRVNTSEVNYFDFESPGTSYKLRPDLTGHLFRSFCVSWYYKFW